MIGGNVIEIIDVPERGRVWVNCKDEYNNTCAIYVDRNDENSLKIYKGDMIWWQGGYAYWTPSGYISGSGGICGKDYEVKIPRIGYSGVSRPIDK